MPENSVSISVKIDTPNIRYKTSDAIRKDVTKMAEKEFRSVASKLFQTVNKRIGRIQSANVLSPALKALQKTGGTHFTVGGLSGSALVKEYNRALGFYNTQTGTLGGARQFTEKMETVLKDRTHDEEYATSVFRALDAISERMVPQLAKNLIDTQQILEELAEKTYNVDLNTIMTSPKLAENFISNAVDKLLSKVDKEMNEGIKELQEGMKSLEGKLF